MPMPNSTFPPPKLTPKSFFHPATSASTRPQPTYHWPSALPHVVSALNLKSMVKSSAIDLATLMTVEEVPSKSFQAMAGELHEDDDVYLPAVQTSAGVGAAVGALVGAAVG